MEQRRPEGDLVVKATRKSSVFVKNTFLDHMLEKSGASKSLFSPVRFPDRLQTCIVRRHFSLEPSILWGLEAVVYLTSLNDRAGTSLIKVSFALSPKAPTGSSAFAYYGFSNVAVATEGGGGEIT